MEDPERFLRKELGDRFTLEENSIFPTTKYLGKKFSWVTLENGTKYWYFRSSQYIKNTVKKVENYLHTKGYKLPARARPPWSRKYRPETDISPELLPTNATYFQFLIIVLRWIVELGGADITIEISALASMVESPRKGHIKEVFQIFDFLKGKNNGLTMFDPTKPDIDLYKFSR